MIRLRTRPPAEPEPRPQRAVGPAWIVTRDGAWLDARLAVDVREASLTTNFGVSWVLVRGLSVAEAEAHARELFALLDSGDKWAHCIAAMVRHDAIHVDDEGGRSLEQFGPHAALHPVHAELKRQREAEAAEIAERNRRASIRREIERLEGELAVTVQP